MAKALRVLIVDDCKDTAHSLAILTELWGHQPWIAHDGHEALAAAEVCQPDVVLLDIGLPRMNGYEVARRLREQTHRLRPLIVAITGYGLEQDRRRAHAAGFDLHLLKPVHPETLRHVLSGMSNRHASGSEGADSTEPCAGEGANSPWTLRHHAVAFRAGMFYSVSGVSN
jgi:CheY-like chemotaxis protein